MCRVGVRCGGVQSFRLVIFIMVSTCGVGDVGFHSLIGC